MASLDGAALNLEFVGEVIQWRGPSPYHFIAMPADPSASVRGIARAVSYGWGCIPVRVRIDETDFTTALIPKDGRYLVRSRMSCASASAWRMVTSSRSS